MIEFIDFYAEWCGPCHAMHPIIEELNKEYAGKVKITKLDVDKNQETAATHNVMSIPTYLILRDGKEVDRRVGAMAKETLKSWIDSYA